MASNMSYRHEANRRITPHYEPLIRIFKDKHRLLDEYIKANNVLIRTDMQKMSFREPKTALINYTKKTGQTFIHIDYDTWHKGEIGTPTPVVRSGRPKFKKKKIYKCRYCNKRISRTSKRGLCRSCSKPPIYNKKQKSSVL